VLFTVLVQMHFVQRKLFSETNVTSHAFQQISDLGIFLNASEGYCKRCGGPHAARWPVVRRHWSMTCCGLGTEFGKNTFGGQTLLFAFRWHHMQVSNGAISRYLSFSTAHIKFWELGVYRQNYAKKLWLSIQIWSVAINKMYCYL